MSDYIISIDQSTSASKAVVFDREAKIKGHDAVSHAQIYPRPGWVEHDPEEIFGNVLKVIAGALNSAGIDGSEVSAIAITDQRETVVVWDKHTGKHVYNAIVWQCNRGADLCDTLRQQGWDEKIREKTGLLIDPYFSATGVAWILDNVEGVREKAGNGDLLFGTMDSWLIWNLTGGKIHATDYSNACRTMLFNINTMAWDKEIMDKLGIPADMAPEVHYADEIFGHTTAGGIFTREIPITGVLGDSHAALFGQCCFTPGLGKATYGTGSSIMMNIGDKPLKSPEGLVTSVGFALRDNTSFVFEGNIHCTGATIQWLKEDLQLIESAAETEGLAFSVESTDGVYLVPAFAGLGAPYWDNQVRGMICGMTLGTKKAHLVRAALEAIAYQVRDLVDLMTQQAGIALKELRVDGGPVKNNFLMQFQADMLNGEINRSDVQEASALGVAIAAGYSLGWWKSLDEINKLRKGAVISGTMQKELSSKLYQGWKEAVKQAMYKS